MGSCRATVLALAALATCGLALAAAAGCGAGDAAAGSARTEPLPAVAPSPPPSRPPFRADFEDAGAGADGGAGAGGDADVDPAFHARLMAELRAVVGPAFDAHDWKTLLRGRALHGGTKVWVPGTGERLADEGTARAMAAVPVGLATHGPALRFTDWTPALGSSFWLGVPSAQSVGGAKFAALDRLSALQVFETAWPDALAIVAALGARLDGAWLVGHSAGALPAVLAGLLGGAHRVDAYGVPSVVGALDGDDGIIHLHTHPLDPAGSMGGLDASGRAQIDLASAFVTTLKAGGSLAYHDYSAWPAPAP